MSNGLAWRRARPGRSEANLVTEPNVKAETEAEKSQGPDELFGVDATTIAVQNFAIVNKMVAIQVPRLISVKLGAGYDAAGMPFSGSATSGRPCEGLRLSAKGGGA